MAGAVNTYLSTSQQAVMQLSLAVLPDWAQHQSGGRGQVDRVDTHLPFRLYVDSVMRAHQCV